MKGRMMEMKKKNEKKKYVKKSKINARIFCVIFKQKCFLGYNVIVETENFFNDEEKLYKLIKCFSLSLSLSFSQDIYKKIN